MHQSVIIVSGLLASFAAAIPLVARQTTLPQEILPNGAVNPFYPCGADDASVQACPYRCYELSTSTGSSLDDVCYDATDAAALVANLSRVCVACLDPPSSQIPSSASSPATCQPLSGYFDYSDMVAPSPCGLLTQPLDQCAWICEEAQTPFSSCSSYNATAPEQTCQACLPQCGSPVIILDPPTLTSSDFSLSSGACSTEYGSPETKACPFRCSGPSNIAGDLYCSLVNLNGTGEGYQVCQAC